MTFLKEASDYNFMSVSFSSDLKSSSVSHASELELLFGPIPSVASVEIPFATQMRDFYINFINDLNPGCKHRCPIATDPCPANLSLPRFVAEWPAFTPSSPRVMQLLRDNITMISDGVYSFHIVFARG